MYCARLKRKPKQHKRNHHRPYLRDNVFEKNAFGWLFEVTRLYDVTLERLLSKVKKMVYDEAPFQCDGKQRCQF